MGLKDTLLMRCSNAAALAEKKRDGKLSLAERIGLQIHLLYCSLCRIFFKQSEIVDKSYEWYADDIDLGDKVHPLDPSRKEALDKAFKDELNK
ncbi:MAG: hypothetical protein JWO03_1845 [Bacteroidetes bacterium]|nr:hypothetical protein [Bacteroidota bacterium]